nr:UbiA family prenyltransferase [Pedococcus sp. 5OH_020]
MRTCQVIVASGARGPRSRSACVRGLLTLIRPVAASAGAAQVVVGGACTAGTRALHMASVLAGAACIFFIIAVANVVNDLVDQAADAISSPARPLPSGAVDRRDAVVLAVLCAVGGIASSAVGPGGMALGTALLLVSVVYSLAIKSTVLAGNATVATLAAFPLTYGVAIAHGALGRALSGSLLILLYMFAYEVLKTIRDIEGDRAVGCVTVGTAAGQLKTGNLFRFLVVVYACVAVAVPLRFHEHPAYFVVMLTGCLVPVAAAAFLLPVTTSAEAVTRMLRSMVLAWLPGLAALWVHLAS